MAFNEEILHRKEPFNIADLQYDNRIEVVKLSCWIINLSLDISFLYNRDIADVFPSVLSSGSSLIRESPIFQILNTIQSFAVVQNKDNRSGLALPLLSSSELHWKQFVSQFRRGEFSSIYAKI